MPLLSAERRSYRVDLDEVYRRNPVVITGMGAILPTGKNVKEIWESALQGDSGISEINIENTTVRVAGQIYDFDRKSLGSLIKPNKTSLAAQYAIFAAQQAIDQAHIGEIDPREIGVRIGTGIGGSIHLNKLLLDSSKLSSNDLQRELTGRCSTTVAMAFNLQGPTAVTCAECASGLSAMIDGCDKLRLNEAKVIIAGGTEAPLDGVTLELFNRSQAYSSNLDPYTASRPFDIRRDGLVMGEGSVVYVMELLDHALTRGAEPIVIVAGFAEGRDAGRNDTTPDGKGTERIMRKALEMAGGVSNEKVVFFHPHATSTLLGDIAEVGAMSIVFNGVEEVLVYLSKGLTAHPMATSGPAGILYCAQALRTDETPPNPNLITVFEQGKKFNYAGGKKRVDIAGVNALGFGGLNVTFFLKRWEDYIKTSQGR